MLQDLNKFRKLMGLRVIQSPTPQEVVYRGIFAAGDMDLGDYGCGLFIVTVFARIESDTPVDCLTFGIRITTIDDGMWGATRHLPVAEATERTHKLFEEITETFGCKLPNEAEINKMLCRYGLYGIAS
jgi:hypothetical protein